MRLFCPPLPDRSVLELSPDFYSSLEDNVDKSVVLWPDAKLVLDIPENRNFSLITRGLVVCSGIAIGFKKGNEAGLYLSHTNPHMAKTATEELDNAVGMAEDNGYSPTFGAIIGIRGSQFGEHNGLIVPWFRQYVDEFDMLAVESTYNFATDWTIEHVSGGFSATATRSRLLDHAYT